MKNCDRLWIAQRELLFFFSAVASRFILYFIYFFVAHKKWSKQCNNGQWYSAPWRVSFFYTFFLRIEWLWYVQKRAWGPIIASLWLAIISTHTHLLDSRSLWIGLVSSVTFKHWREFESSPPWTREMKNETF
jgi:hypothetical protein